MALETISTSRSFGGAQGVYKHASAATCTHANVTEKGEFRRTCAELGLIFIAPDTSPRGEGVVDDVEGAYDFGLGAGFYVDATEEPFVTNYRMSTYITQELPALVAQQFPVDVDRQSIMSHSMGGYNALTMALTFPHCFKAVSAFSPIVAPSRVAWGQKALQGYLGDNQAAWRKHDSVALIEDGACIPDLLIDQGEADAFLTEQLKPQLLANVCEAVDIPLMLRFQPGYDHSYYFISTFMADHLRWHADRL